jgi:hypothetical protein
VEQKSEVSGQKSEKAKRKKQTANNKGNQHSAIRNKKAAMLFELIVRTAVRL